MAISDFINDDVYKEKFDLKLIEEILEGMLSSKVSKKKPFMVNEGNGWIPVEQSKAFDEAMKNLKEPKCGPSMIDQIYNDL